jgi:hypothetical protein
MNKTDRTGEKLVNSMLKNKAAAADRADSSVREASDGEKKRALSQTGNKSTGSRPSSAGTKPRGGGDLYQSGHRVWPD